MNNRRRVAEEPRLGADDLTCDCLRMVGLDWIPLPAVASATGGLPIPTLLLAVPVPESGRA